MFLSLIASISALLIIFSTIPQIFKIKKNKSADNVSKTTYYMLLIASIFLVIYGVITWNSYLFVGFIITSTSSALILLQIRQYSK